MWWRSNGVFLLEVFVGICQDLRVIIDWTLNNIFLNSLRMDFFLIYYVFVPIIWCNRVRFLCFLFWFISAFVNDEENYTKNNDSDNQPYQKENGPGKARWFFKGRAYWIFQGKAFEATCTSRPGDAGWTSGRTLQCDRHITFVISGYGKASCLKQVPVVGWTATEATSIYSAGEAVKGADMAGEMGLIGIGSSWTLIVAKLSGWIVVWGWVGTVEGG